MSHPPRWLVPLAWLLQCALVSTQVARASADSILVFNEIHYNPADGSADSEWIEFHNLNGVDVDVSGWRLRGGADFDFPEGTVGLGYYFLGSGIDDALALKASIPDHKRLDFLKNELFEKGDKSKASILIGRDKPWWNLDDMKERVDRKMQLPKGKYVECALGKENGKWTVYVSWMST